MVALGGACGGGGDDSSVTPEGGATTLAATSQHFDSDFTQVCRGTGVEWATPYDPAQTGAHKVVVLQGSDEANLTPLSTGNADWDVLFDAETDAYAAVELVACAVRTSDELAQTCTGYEDDDGNDSGQTVEYYSATYSTTLRAATTAEVIDEATIEAIAGQCPMLVYFDEGSDTKTEYESVDANSFLLPYAST